MATPSTDSARKRSVDFMKSGTGTDERPEDASFVKEHKVAFSIENRPDGKEKRRGSFSNTFKLYSREAMHAGKAPKASPRSTPAAAPAFAEKRSVSAPAQNRRLARANSIGNLAAKTTSSVRRASVVGLSNLRRSEAGLMRVVGVAQRGVYAHSDAAAKLFAKIGRRERVTRRERMFLFLSEPGMSNGSFWFGTGIFVMLLVATVVRVLESLTAYRTPSNALAFTVARFVVNVVFSAEAVLRVASHVPFNQTYKSVYIWLDVLTVVPFWLRLLLLPSTLLEKEHYFDRGDGGVAEAIRVLDALASIRLLKIARYYEGAEQLARGMARSASQLLVPLFMLVISTHTHRTPSPAPFHGLAGVPCAQHRLTPPCALPSTGSHRPALGTGSHRPVPGIQLATSR